MNENLLDRDEAQVDIQRLLMVVLKKSCLIAAISLLGAVLAFAATFFLIKPKYQASAKFYVNNNAVSMGGASLSISSADLVTSRSLVDSYIVILKTRESINDVIDYAGVDRDYDEITDMLSAAAVNETEIFQVTVTSTDPVEAEKIADAIAYTLPNRISSIIEGTSAKVVEAAVTPARPSSPSYLKNIVVGFLLGFALTVAYVALREIFDVSIREDEDVARSCRYPVLAAVPDMTAPGKGSSYYSNSGKRKKGGAYAANRPAARCPELIGEGISFAASEAYKLLRTKLQFSFAGDGNCRVIGLSSALSGEGKSLTSVNLAYTLAQLDKKVILIDCDMRRPTLAEKMGVLKSPGLSNYLTGQCRLKDLLQVWGEKKTIHVVSAGQNPPNPVELLSSKRMQMAVAALRKYYDYVILDLPPVGEVSDAMAVAKEADGMLLVVRQNYCDRVALAEAVRQFDFIQAKILGVVFNCTVESAGQYGKGYYKQYDNRYGSNHENNGPSASSAGKRKARL